MLIRYTHGCPPSVCSLWPPGDGGRSPRTSCTGSARWSYTIRYFELGGRVHLLLFHSALELFVGQEYTPLLVAGEIMGDLGDIDLELVESNDHLRVTPEVLAQVRE